MVPSTVQCCGECVRKRCTFKNQTFNIGDTWSSEDKCRVYKCTPNLMGNLTEAKIVLHEKPCTTNISIFNNFDKDFLLHAEEDSDAAMSQETYVKHPCRRECTTMPEYKICYYKFFVSVTQYI